MVLKTLPVKVQTINIFKIELINYNLIQRSLIAFQNDDQDELFDYYDNRNKLRLRKLGYNAATTEVQAEDIKEVSHNLLYIVNSIIHKNTIGNVQTDNGKKVTPGGN